MGVGRLGYHLTAYQEGKEYKIKKFKDFINENK